MIDKIILIGYRASGKSTIGAELARVLNFDFLDTDDLICAQKQTTIREIVENEGWDGFRSCEAEVLREVCVGRRRVVSTGGGAVLHRKVWQKIRHDAFVVWLYADTGILAERLYGHGRLDEMRPSLTGETIQAEIESVLSERIPLYEEYADLKVDTGLMAKPEVVERIVESYHKRCDGSVE
jgi:shikimate kinase